MSVMTQEKSAVCRYCLGMESARCAFAQVDEVRIHVAAALVQDPSLESPVLSLSSSNRDTRNRILRRGSPRRCRSKCCSTHLREGATALPRSVPVDVVVVVATSVAVPGRQHYNAAKGSPSVTRLRYPRLPTHALRRFVRILRRT